jgi:hypothetical protein
VTWLPIAAWGVAALVALVVLGVCAYEIAWKTKRLRRDLVNLQQDADELAQLRSSLNATQRQLAVRPR